MIPLIEDEIVGRQKWISKEDFLDLVVVGQTAPGIIAINMALLVGHRVAGRKGAFYSALASALPSYVTILIIAMFIQQFQDNRYFIAAFKALRPAVVALIAVPLWNMAQRAKLNYKTAWIPIAAALLICYAGVSPVFIVLAGGLGGVLLTYFKERRMRK